VGQRHLQVRSFAPFYLREFLVQTISISFVSLFLFALKSPVDCVFLVLRIAMTCQEYFTDVIWGQIGMIDLYPPDREEIAMTSVLLRHVQKMVNVRIMSIEHRLSFTHEPNMKIAASIMPRIIELYARETMPRALLDRIDVARLEFLHVLHDDEENEPNMQFSNTIEYLMARGPLRKLETLKLGPIHLPPIARAFSQFPANLPSLKELETPLLQHSEDSESEEDSSEADLLAALGAVAQHANLNRLHLADMHAPRLFGDMLDPEMWRNLPQFVRQNLKIDITEVIPTNCSSLWILMPLSMVEKHPDVYTTIFEACYKTDSARLDAISARLDYGGMQPVALPWMITKVEPLIKRTHAKDLVEGDAESERWFGQIAWVIMHLLSWNPTNTDGVWGVLQGEFNRLVDELGFSKYLSLALRPDHRFSAGRMVSTLMGQSEEWWYLHNVTEAVLKHVDKSELTFSPLLDRLQKSSRFMESIMVDSAFAKDVARPKLQQLYRVGKDDAEIDALLKELQKFISSTGLTSSLQQAPSKILPVWLRTEDRARQVGSFFSDFGLLVHFDWVWRTIGAMGCSGVRNFRVALQAHAKRFLEADPCDEEYFLESLWKHYTLSLSDFLTAHPLVRVTEALEYSASVPRRAVDILSISSELFFNGDTRRSILEYILSVIPESSPAFSRLVAVTATL
jgi:hypothetical protein